MRSANLFGKEFLNHFYEEFAENIIVRKMGNIPEIAINLGFMTLSEYIIYAASTKAITLSDLAIKISVNYPVLIPIIHSLTKKGVIQLKWAVPNEKINPYLKEGIQNYLKTKKEEKVWYIVPNVELV